ncbi:SCO5918 family protein [Streptomyces sp. TRM72054]|uniref:SCO5918 family protein n=1 Tax=unclassified Streptomyces TaxID=2593676 RepID=UPI00148812A5|nr:MULTISPECIES: SCO5918 family protein [unclassified Streptomyces]MBX9397549.1 SCO5918 family protein [Streptomyces sp. TRM72054]
MRCVIARFPFDLTKSEVEQSMSGITPEPVTGVSVTIGRRVYPVMQVGEVITRQNRRDFTTVEMRRALTRLGFSCHEAPPVAPTGDARADEGLLGW